MLQERTGLSAEQISQRVDALVITRGSEGSVVIREARSPRSRRRDPARSADPTGCGDAYRAGLLYGLMAGADWETTGRIASLMGAIKISSHGTQNHRLNPDDFRERFMENFGYEPGV